MPIWKLVAVLLFGLCSVSFAGPKEERQKLLDALKGKPEPAVTQPVVPIEKPEEKKNGTVVKCPDVKEDWKPTQLPMVFDDGKFYYGRLTLADYVAFAGLACHSCHRERKLKLGWCESQVYRDGKWAWPNGLLHDKHRRLGCTACHRLER